LNCSSDSNKIQTLYRTLFFFATNALIIDEYSDKYSFLIRAFVAL